MSKPGNYLTRRVHLFRQCGLITKHLIHDLGAQIQLRSHLILHASHLSLNAFHVAHPREQQIDALGHPLPVRILLLEDELGLSRGLGRCRDGKLQKVHAQGESTHVSSRSPTTPKRRSGEEVVAGGGTANLRYAVAAADWESMGGARTP